MPRNASVTLDTVAARVGPQLNPAEQDFVPAKTAAQRREAHRVVVAAGRAKRKEADREATAQRMEAARAKRSEEEVDRDREADRVREAKVAARAKRA